MTPALSGGQQNTVGKRDTEQPGCPLQASIHPRKKMVPERGVEPPTFALRMRCSTN